MSFFLKTLSDKDFGGMDFRATHEEDTQLHQAMLASRLESHLAGLGKQIVRQNFAQGPRLKAAKLGDRGICMGVVVDWLRRRFTGRREYWDAKYDAKDGWFGFKDTSAEKKLTKKLFDTHQLASKTKVADHHLSKPVTQEIVVERFNTFRQLYEESRQGRTKARGHTRDTSGLEQLALSEERDVGAGLYNYSTTHLSRKHLECAHGKIGELLEDLARGVTPFDTIPRGMILLTARDTPIGDEKRKPGSHAVAFATDGKVLSYFDPNFGKWDVEFGTAGMELLAGVWADYLALYYPSHDTFTRTWVGHKPGK